MSQTNEQSADCGLILLGNSGVGKSFLANRLLDANTFQSKFSPRSVTRETESAPIEFNGKKYVVYNIPGLIEADQTLINQNIQEIKKAFEMSSNSIVIFIFGQLAGRINDEQFVTYQLLNTACNFKPESLLILVNNISDEVSEGYEDNVRYLLTNLTGATKDHICFLKQAQTPEDKQQLHETLWKDVTKCMPMNYKMTNDIKLVVEDIPQLKKESKKQQEDLLALKNPSTAGETEIIESNNPQPVNNDSVNINLESTSSEQTVVEPIVASSEQKVAEPMVASSNEQTVVDPIIASSEQSVVEPMVTSSNEQTVVEPIVASSNEPTVEPTSQNQ